MVSLYFVLKLVWKISNILSNYNFLRLSHSHLPAPQKVSSFYFYFSSLLFICSFSRFGHRDNGRISTHPRTSLCIQISDKKKLWRKQKIALGTTVFFFTIVWGNTEILLWLIWFWFYVTRSKCTLSTRINIVWPVSQTCVCLHDVNLVMTYCIPLQVVHSFLMAVEETIPVAMNN